MPLHQALALMGMFLIVSAFPKPLRFLIGAAWLFYSYAISPEFPALPTPSNFLIT